MKIRNELVKKKRYAFAGIIGAFAMVVFSGNIIREFKSEYSMFLGMGIFAAAILYSHFGIKCPKCRQSMGQILMQIGTPFTIPDKFKYCPYCGVNIDSEIEKKFGGLTTG